MVSFLFFKYSVVIRLGTNLRVADIHMTHDEYVNVPKESDSNPQKASMTIPDENMKASPSQPTKGALPPFSTTDKLVNRLEGQHANISSLSTTPGGCYKEVNRGTLHSKLERLYQEDVKEVHERYATRKHLILSLSKKDEKQPQSVNVDPPFNETSIDNQIMLAHVPSDLDRLDRLHENELQEALARHLIEIILLYNYNSRKICDKNLCTSCCNSH